MSNLLATEVGLAKYPWQLVPSKILACSPVHLVHDLLALEFHLFNNQLNCLKTQLALF